MNRHILAASVIGLLFLAPVSISLHADGTRYVVENLGTIDGLVPVITGMNASGQISGYIANDAGLRAVRFSGGAWHYVPGLESVYSAATAINAHGDLTGYATNAAGQLVAYRYSDGGGVALLPALQNHLYDIGMAINADGVVVGYGTDLTGSTRGWVARPGADIVMLPTFGGGFSVACGINDNGQIVGSSTTTDNFQHAFRLDADGSMHDTGTFDGAAGTSAACAIDADGRVGGQATRGGDARAFLFEAGVLSDIGDFPGSLFSTVDATAGGVSVGYFFAPDGSQRATVHTATDGSRDLNTAIAGDAGWVLSEATTVNDQGQIAGAGMLAGATAAFRLTPVPGDTTPPVIDAFSATPSSVTPPNKAMVSIAFAASATDNSDPSPVCEVTSVDGHGSPAGDSAVVGPFSGAVRAVGGTTYTFTVTCHDASGNAATRGVDVVVPPDTTAPAIASLTASPSIVWPPNDAMVPVTVSLSATDDSEEAPVCSLASITSAGAPAGDSSITGPFAALVRAVGGRTYSLRAACHDAAGNAATRDVDVVVPADTTAPSIARLGVTPSTVWPPNGAMVPVTVAVRATDDSGEAPVCGLAWISSRDAGPDDSSITGPFTALVRAIGGRTYSLRVACSDRSGNTASAAVNVVVPPDTTAPSIASLTATPSRIWPPNGKMVSVSVSVDATDDVDAAPRCTLTSIVGGSSSDSSINGALSASVRANKEAVYTLVVTCSDRAGNKSRAAVNVIILKDDPSAAAKKSDDDRNGSDRGKGHAGN